MTHGRQVLAILNLCIFGSTTIRRRYSLKVYLLENQPTFCSLYIKSFLKQIIILIMGTLSFISLSCPNIFVDLCHLNTTIQNPQPGILHTLLLVSLSDFIFYSSRVPLHFSQLIYPLYICYTLQPA